MQQTVSSTRGVGKGFLATFVWYSVSTCWGDEGRSGCLSLLLLGESHILFFSFSFLMVSPLQNGCLTEPGGRNAGPLDSSPCAHSLPLPCVLSLSHTLGCRGRGTLLSLGLRVWFVGYSEAGRDSCPSWSLIPTQLNRGSLHGASLVPLIPHRVWVKHQLIPDSLSVQIYWGRTTGWGQHWGSPWYLSF